MSTDKTFLGVAVVGIGKNFPEGEIEEEFKVGFRQQYLVASL